VDDARIESLETDLRPESDGREYLTIDFVSDKTVIDPLTDERRTVTLPATYDPNIPYEDWGNGKWVRVRHPLEESADHGIARDSAVTGD